MATKVEKQTEPDKDQNPFIGQVFHLDKFKGIEPGGWQLTWTAALNRMVVLAIATEPKDGWNPMFDLEAALAKLGYTKGSGKASATDLRLMLRRVLETCRLNEDDSLQGDIERLLA